MDLGSSCSHQAFPTGTCRKELEAAVGKPTDVWSSFPHLLAAPDASGDTEEQRGNWKLKQSHKIKLQPDDFSLFKPGSNAANPHPEGADGAVDGDLTK